MENVTPEVFDILDMTGFTQLLTVRKALRQVSVEGLTEIGHGQNGHIYRMDPDTIVKVFNANIDYSMIQNEINKSKVAAFSCARFLLGLLRIPDLMTPAEMALYKSRFIALYKKGIELLCF